MTTAHTPTAIEANVALVRTVLDAFGRGDLDTVGAAFAPDAVWDLPGRGTLAGTYRGRDAIVGFLARSFELSGGTLRVEPIDVLSARSANGYGVGTLRC